MGHRFSKHKIEKGIRRRDGSSDSFLVLRLRWPISWGGEREMRHEQRAMIESKGVALGSRSCEGVMIAHSAVAHRRRQRHR